ncbi:uncharacterized protein LOC121101436 isoform X1 [Ursus maritimus]|uniref:Uncharacterized protein LOC121101436 isoform X1 n=1 Tax=Ursus maritimus TaxID=29073 RepID=A0A8M1FC21_URSMA|nr:uncharacterized protein LOC121101436 isoform X1 [Ursus maritimus]
MEASELVAAPRGEEASCSSWGAGSSNTNLPIVSESVEIDDALYRNWRCLAWRKKTLEPEYHLQMFGGLSHRRGIRQVPYGPKESTEVRSWRHSNAEDGQVPCFLKWYGRSGFGNCKESCSCRN